MSIQTPPRALTQSVTESPFHDRSPAYLNLTYTVSDPSCDSPTKEVHPLFRPDNEDGDNNGERRFDLPPVDLSVSPAPRKALSTTALPRQSHTPDAHTSRSASPTGSPVMNRGSRVHAASGDHRHYAHPNGNAKLHPRSDFSHSLSASNLSRLPSAPTPDTPPSKTKPFSTRPSLSHCVSLTPQGSTTAAPGNINTPGISTTPTNAPGSPIITHHIVKTAFWVSLAVVVAVILSFVRGKQTALEFTTAYIVEYSLSVDNLFVFLIIFRYFKVPHDSQESVLTYGIIGAMILRGLMIVCGKALIDKFEWVTIIFAVFLIYSAIKLFLEGDDDDDDESALDNNRIVRLARTLLPVSDRYTGDRFFIYENSKFLATPLMVVLISIELSDVVFALDSVPAVLGLSKDTFVIYTSNILAIMGLRSLFFILSSSIGTFRFLRHALATVLGFIGIKMVASWLGYDIGTVASLAFVACCLLLGIGCSMAFPAPDAPSSTTNGNTAPEMDGVNSNQSNLNNV